MIPYEWLEQADSRISPYIRRTPLTFDAARNIYIKWENHQVTGSFKARGAFNKVLLLEDWEREAGLVAASAGNHGQGVALAGQKVGARVEVFVSEHAVSAKIDAMRSLGAVIHTVPGGYPEAETAGKAYAEEQGKTWVSPYNDGQVIAGQGTVGLELLQALTPSPSPNGGGGSPPLTTGDEPGMWAWLVPVSGGGLLAGMGSSLREQAHCPRLIGVQAAVAPFMHSLFYKDTQVGLPDLPSLADGLTGEVEQGSVTIPMVKKLVDEILLVSEDEIARAIAFAWSAYGEKLEGAGAVGLAAILSNKVNERPALVVVSGGNVQPEVHAEIVQRFAGETWN
ncbi:MAG: threonine/serine dehydratase [Anaerolineales bacterium]